MIQNQEKQKKKDKISGPAWFDEFKVQKYPKPIEIYLMKTMEIKIMVTWSWRRIYKVLKELEAVSLSDSWWGYLHYSCITGVTTD